MRFRRRSSCSARRAASIAPREALGGWLHGVARRTAAKARAKAIRRRKQEKTTSLDQSQITTLPAEPRSELAALLDQELSRLPGRYRTPIVLCELEGLTRVEAARQLGWPEGTVASRLARGRNLLASRLKRRGLTLSTAAGLLAFAQGQASATILSRELIALTVDGGCRGRERTTRDGRLVVAVLPRS